MSVLPTTVLKKTAIGAAWLLAPVASGLAFATATVTPVDAKEQGGRR